MSWFSDLLTGGDQAAGYRDMESQIRAAMDQMNKQYGSAQSRIAPYGQIGMTGMQDYTSRLNQMKDPTGFMNNIMSQYQSSPWATFQTKNMMDTLNNNAAASGSLDSGALQKRLMQYGQGITSQDQQNYLQNALGINNQYLSGEQGLGQMGANTALQQGNWDIGQGKDIAGLLGNLGQAQFGEKSTEGQAWQQLLGLGAGWLSSPIGQNGNPFGGIGKSGGGSGGSGGGGGSSIMSILPMILSML
jgi:hypothetical protein